MNDVKLGNIELARMARQPASAPQAKSNQVAAYAEVKQAAGPLEPQKASASKSAREADEVKEAQAAKSPPISEKEQEEEVKEAVTKLNDYVQSIQRDLQFSLDRDSGRTVVTVTDRNTKEVVRQIPDELALKLARNLQQDEPLSLFNVKV